MKVIEPLFLNDLYEAFEKAKGNPKKLNELLHRLSNLKIFDPACGSGNFLIIAYKELRKLEIKIIHHLQELQQAASGFNPKSEQLSIIPKAQLSLAASFQVELFSRIQLSQFYGIEIDDFAHEVAQLSLWLAEHQMNTEFFKEFGQTNPTLPLKEAGNIVQGNACRLDWETVCPKEEGDEIYILGNPPYHGFSQQDKDQKKDLTILKLGTIKIDYISVWFVKSSKFINESKKIFAAFVSTNSICQGEQTSTLWPNVLKDKLEIFFAYQSFKWGNNAKSKAAVICIIVGIRLKSSRPKYIFTNNRKLIAANINPYLVDAPTVYVEKRTKSLSNLTPMQLGNMPYDRGILHFDEKSYIEFISTNPETKRFIRRIVGSKEYINDILRYTLWIRDNDLYEANQTAAIKNLIDLNKKTRITSIDPGVRKLASKPHQFREMREPVNFSLVLPGTSSERRRFIPVGYLNKDIIVNNLAFAIYDPEPYILGIITSTMHMSWVRSVAGRLKSDYRYSSVICYNTFPFPPISDQRKQEITQCSFRILEEREKHPEKTLAQLYDPDKMPTGLREAHHQNDLAIERCYRTKPFESDEERLEYLFKLYEQMIEEEKEQGTLFAKEKKKNKKGK